jgi:hypothetical protein
MIFPDQVLFPVFKGIVSQKNRRLLASLIEAIEAHP